METIIDANGDLSRHKIKKYTFKKLDMNDDTSHIHETASDEQLAQAKDSPIVYNDEDDTTSSTGSLLNAKDLQEITNGQSSMLHKIEELYQFVDSIRGDIANQSQTMNTHFQNNLQQSYQDGIRIGEEESRKKSEVEVDEIKGRLIEAINIFTNETTKVQSLLDNLENELVKTSIDIAHEVIKVTLDDRAQQVALGLSKELVKELQNASDITIKVNPMDVDFIRNNINNDKIIIENDIAVARGGVVVLSSLGNIDGSIKERFAKVKATFYENLNQE
jgi:flagellar assembly protein FliH